MKLRCQCCSFEQEFKDDEEAFKAGWDAPPHFTTHITCHLCPTVCLLEGESHKKAHELWAKNGRPKEFSLLECGIDEDIGDAKKDKDLNESFAQFKAADTIGKVDFILAMLEKAKAKNQ